MGCLPFSSILQRMHRQHAHLRNGTTELTQLGPAATKVRVQFTPFLSRHMLADSSRLDDLLIKTSVDLGIIQCLWMGEFVLFFMCHGHMANESHLGPWCLHRLQDTVMPWRRLGQATSNVSDGSVRSRIHAPSSLSCALDIAVESIELAASLLRSAQDVD